MVKLKTLILVISLAGNALAVILVAAAIASGGGSASLSFYRREEGIATAMIVSVPPDSIVTFNPVEITLHKGDSALFQFSSVINDSQANWIIQALYDRSLVEVRQNPAGITITAVNPGICVIQTLTNDGIMDIAVIRVIE